MQISHSRDSIPYCRRAKREVGGDLHLRCNARRPHTLLRFKMRPRTPRSTSVDTMTVERSTSAVSQMASEAHAVLQSKAPTLCRAMTADIHNYRKRVESALRTLDNEKFAKVDKRRVHDFADYQLTVKKLSHGACTPESRREGESAARRTRSGRKSRSHRPSPPSARSANRRRQSSQSTQARKIERTPRACPKTRQAVAFSPL